MTPATVALPIRVPHGYWRLLLLVGGLVFFLSAPWWILLQSITSYSYFGLQIVIPAAMSAALLVFAVVTALLEMRERTRWLVVFAVVIGEGLNFHALQLVVFAVYFEENPALLDMLHDQVSLHLIIGLGTVLAIHALLWPVRARLGWQVHWAGEVPAAKERLLTIWHLAGSVAFVAILLVHAGPSANQFLLSQFFSLLANLAVGLAVLILATQRKHLAIWIPAGLAGGVGLTLAEWGLTYFNPTVAGGGGGFSLWSWGIWNCAVAGSVLFIVFLLRWSGLRFHLPMTRPKVSLGMPASTDVRRRFQFTLRSVFLLTTLLCLGPGSYIAWERERCRKGSEALAQTEELLGKQNSTQQRPAWLQALIGDHSYRQLRLIFSKQTTTTDADLACLSGLPNIDTLCLDRTQVTGVGLDSLPNAKRILALQLSGTQVSDESLVHFAPLSGLKYLTLDKTKVTDAGLVHLSGLTNLRMLLLRDTNLTDDGLAHLTPLLDLETLLLDNTGVGDAGLNQLPPDLKALGLSGTPVTNAGLATIARLTKLEYLNLSNSSITDAGLVQLENLPNLQALTVTNTQVTDAGVANLQKKLPALKIQR